MEDSLPETVSLSDLREEGGGKMGCAWRKRSVSVGFQHHSPNRYSLSTAASGTLYRQEYGERGDYSKG